MPKLAVAAGAALVAVVALFFLFRYVDDWRFCNQANNLGQPYTPARLLRIASQEGRPLRGPYTVNGVQYPADPPFHDPIVYDAEPALVSNRLRNFTGYVWNPQDWDLVH